jgi:hypothetical protein
VCDSTGHRLGLGDNNIQQRKCNVSCFNHCDTDVTVLESQVFVKLCTGYLLNQDPLTEDDDIKILSIRLCLGAEANVYTLNVGTGNHDFTVS